MGDGFDLRLVSAVNGVSDITAEGKNLVVVARVDQVLHFRIFDGDGKRIVDTDEKRLRERVQPIEDLRNQLVNLWPPHELTESEKRRVIPAVTSIVGHTLDDTTHETTPLPAMGSDVGHTQNDRSKKPPPRPAVGSDPDPKALEYFRAWSNGLLLATTGAVGWIASKDHGPMNDWVRGGCLIIFGLSIVFAMLTLAWIPMIAEQRDRGESFYDVTPLFSMMGKSRKGWRIKCLCLPQHGLFILGIAVYVLGVTFAPPSPDKRESKTNQVGPGEAPKKSLHLDNEKTPKDLRQPAPTEPSKVPAKEQNEEVSKKKP